MTRATLGSLGTELSSVFGNDFFKLMRCVTRANVIPSLGLLSTTVVLGNVLAEASLNESMIVDVIAGLSHSTFPVLFTRSIFDSGPGFFSLVILPHLTDCLAAW